jgi:hypothetical protein
VALQILRITHSVGFIFCDGDNECQGVSPP